METPAQWYYADANRQQRGPLTREALIAALDRGELNASTLVWRSGFAAWQPLSSCADELGLHGRALPPALPSSGSAPGTAANDVVYAGFLRRWAALILDNIVLCVSLLIVCVLVGIGLGAGSVEPANAFAIAYGLYYVLWLVVTPLYYAGQESSRHQATLGKRALSIKVSDLEGRRLGFGRALARWFAAALSYFTFYVGFFMAGFTERKQALHDIVAGTLVVDRWAWTDHPERQQRDLGGGPIALIALLFIPFVIAIIGILAAIALPAYQDYVLRAKVLGAINQGHALESTIAEAFATQGRCPKNGEAGIAEAGSYASGIVAGIAAIERADGRCGLDIVLSAPQQPKLDGKTIHLTLNRGADSDAGDAWECHTDLEKRIVGPRCIAGGEN